MTPCLQPIIIIIIESHDLMSLNVNVALLRPLAPIGVAPPPFTSMTIELLFCIYDCRMSPISASPTLDSNCGSNACSIDLWTDDLNFRSDRSVTALLSEENSIA